MNQRQGRKTSQTIISCLWASIKLKSKLHASRIQWHRINMPIPKGSDGNMLKENWIKGRPIENTKLIFHGQHQVLMMTSSILQWDHIVSFLKLYCLWYRWSPLGTLLRTYSFPWQMFHVSASSSALQYLLQLRLHLCSFVNSFWGALCRESSPTTYCLSSSAFWDNGSVFHEDLTLSHHAPVKQTLHGW